MSSILRLTLKSTAFGLGVYIAHLIVSNEHNHLCKTNRLTPILPAGSLCPIKKPLPSRCNQIENLRDTKFDVLVIGGGATGTGCALDAVTRGLNTALVEADDFASGTSSRSTKMVHGGVRYLHSAVTKLDKNQYALVREALRERAHVLHTAPHLAHKIPILLPVYKFWEIPFYWVGMKMYDVVAGMKILNWSYYLSKSKTMEAFPMLKSENLKGSIVYYDGSMNDARLALALAMTAAHYGAAVTNHVRVLELKYTKTDQQREVSGARVRDELTGEEFDICAKCVINATGSFTDTIRLMDDPGIEKICSPSSGVHIVLPGYYAPADMGMLDPSSDDDRVLFFLPWLNHTIAGTTDTKCEVTTSPRPTEDEIDFILREMKKYMSSSVQIRRGDVLSAWCGVRPLVRDPNAKNTSSLARTHVVEISNSHMISISGGKWTTYRAMAEETVTKAINTCKLKPKHSKKCRTLGLKVEGAHKWTPTLHIRLVQDYGLAPDVAQHLSSYYGDRSFCIAEMAAPTGLRWPIVGNRLHPDFPYIEAEIRFAIKEYACTAVDVIARRLNLCFLNSQAAYEVLPNVIDIMARELDWGETERRSEYEDSCKFLYEQMALMPLTSNRYIPQNLTPTEVEYYSSRFKRMDEEQKGYVTVNNVKCNLRRHGDDVPKEQMNGILATIDPKRNGQLELGEYLLLMHAIKYGISSYNKEENNSAQNTDKRDLKFVSTEHCCGDI